METTIKHKLFSAILQNTKAKIVQQGKTCILNVYILRAIKTFYVKIHLM